MENDIITGESVDGLSLGQTVFVTPRYPNAIGRGVGTIQRLGKVIVLVLFTGQEHPIVCFRGDCQPHEEGN